MRKYKMNFALIIIGMILGLCLLYINQMVLKRNREEFHHDLLVRDSLLEKVESDCKKLEGV